MDCHVGQIGYRGHVADGVGGGHQSAVAIAPVAKLAVLVNALQHLRVTLAQPCSFQQRGQLRPVDAIAIWIGDNFHVFLLTDTVQIGSVLANGALITADVAV
ncbi:hypothetical protein D3C71_1900310 [compost metagenome]